MKVILILKSYESWTGFDQDPRRRRDGLHQDLLKYIRKRSLAYIHGHEVGGAILVF